MLLTSTVCLFCVTKTIVSNCTMNSVHHGIMSIIHLWSSNKKESKKTQEDNQNVVAHRISQIASHSFNRLLRCYISYMYTHANDDILLFTLGSQQWIFFFGVSMSLQLVVMVNTVNTVNTTKKSPWSSPPLNWGVYRSSWRNLPKPLPLGFPNIQVTHL